MGTTTAREIHLLDRDWYAADPYADYAWLRTEAPVYYSEAAKVWGLTRHEDVSWAERHPELLSSAPGSRPYVGPQPSMIDADDPLHYRRRKLVSKGFTPRRIAGMEDHVRGIVGTLIDRMTDGKSSADLVREFSAVLPMTLIGELLGIKHGDHGKLQHWADVMVMLSDGGEMSHLAGEAFKEYLTYTLNVIEERRGQAPEDLIGTLVHAEVDGSKLSTEELVGESLLLLVGGNETTRNVISGGLNALLRNPSQLAALRADPSLIPTAVEEALRWVSPVVNMARHTTQDIELHGVTIPKGETVMMLYGAANRDADVFDDPETFNAFRTPNPHIAFGSGPHFCLGSSLARLEIRVAFEEILRRLPSLRLASDEPLQHAPSSFIRGIAAMPVEF